MVGSTHLLSLIMVSMRSSVLSCMPAAGTRGCVEAANGDTSNAEHSEGSSSNIESFMGSVVWGLGAAARASDGDLELGGNIVMWPRK